MSIKINANMNIRNIRRDFGPREEALILQDFNENKHLAVEAIQKVADAVKYVPKANEVKWENKFAVDSETRKCVAYVLWITRLVASAATTWPRCKIVVAYFHEEKMLSFSVGEFAPYGYGAIRVENGFPLFMAICAAMHIKPHRMNALNSKYQPMSMMYSNLFAIELQQRLYSKTEMLMVSDETKQMHTMNGYELKVHAKHVNWVLNTLAGKRGYEKSYAEWLEYANAVYQKLNPALDNPFLGLYIPYKNVVTCMRMGDGTRALGICSYQKEHGKWVWTGDVKWIPGTEKDYEAYLKQYPNRRLPELHY